MLEAKRFRLGDALAARLPSLTSLERAWAISTTERVDLISVVPSVLLAAREDPSPIVQAALVIDGYEDADDPGLARMCEDPDPVVRDMGIAGRDRLRGGARIHRPKPAPMPDETPPEEPGAEP